MNNCSDHWPCFKTLLRSNRNFKIVSTEKEVKILMRILLFTPSTKKILSKTLRAIPRYAESAHCPKTAQSASERLKWPDVPFPFWAARYDCGRKAYIFPQLPLSQDLNYWSNIFPQHFKIHFQVIVQKLERQKWVHQEMKPGAENNNKVCSSSCSYPQSHSLHAAYGRVHALQSAVNSPL